MSTDVLCFQHVLPHTHSRSSTILICIYYTLSMCLTHSRVVRLHPLLLIAKVCHSLLIQTLKYTFISHSHLEVTGGLGVKALTQMWEVQSSSLTIAPRVANAVLVLALNLHRKKWERQCCYIYSLTYTTILVDKNMPATVNQFCISKFKSQSVQCYCVVVMVSCTPREGSGGSGVPRSIYIESTNTKRSLTTLPYSRKISRQKTFANWVK